MPLELPERQDRQVSGGADVLPGPDRFFVKLDDPVRLVDINCGLSIIIIVSTFRVCCFLFIRNMVSFHQVGWFRLDGHQICFVVGWMPF